MEKVNVRKHWIDNMVCAGREHFCVLIINP